MAARTLCRAASSVAHTAVLLPSVAVSSARLRTANQRQEGRSFASSSRVRLDEPAVAAAEVSEPAPPVPAKAPRPPKTHLRPNPLASLPTAVLPSSSSKSTAASKLPQAFLTVEPLPQTHGIHVASLQFRAYPDSLDRLIFFTSFAMRAARALGLPTSGVVSLPTRTSLYTVPRSPFAHKKSQENFHFTEHRRAIKVYDGDEYTVEQLKRYLREEAMPGVGVKVQTFRYRGLDFAQAGTGAGATSSGAKESEKEQVEKLAKELMEELKLEEELAASSESVEAIEPAEDSLSQSQNQSKGKEQAGEAMEQKEVDKAAEKAEGAKKEEGKETTTDEKTGLNVAGK